MNGNGRNLNAEYQTELFLTNCVLSGLQKVLQ